MIEESSGLSIEIDPDTFPWVKLEDRADLAASAGVSKWGDLSDETKDGLSAAFYAGHKAEAKNYEH